MLKGFKQQDYQTTQWSGGSTTELFIWPEGANFASQDFELRISIATVEVETSTFTKLPGVDRILTVLEGDHHLAINNDTYRSIPPFTPVSFSGNDEVKSKGKAVNFNVMTTNALKGSCSVKIMNYSDEDAVTIDSKGQHVFVYVLEGKLSCGGETFVSGEAVLLHGMYKLELSEEVRGIEVWF